MELDQNFKEFVELLNRHKVEYLIIGGYAVIAQGIRGQQAILMCG